MKNYLSIGEVSKIKGVSIKSLRYYGDLGILPPIYINPKTGYRYYSIDQLLMVDLIKICIDLDIPLKQFQNYFDLDGQMDMGKLLCDAEDIVLQKEKKLKTSMAFLNTMSKHMKRTNKIKEHKENFIQHIPKRYFLTVPWNGDFSDYRKISEKYTMLFRQCQQLHMSDTFNQGVFFVRKEDAIESYVFLEIHKPEIEISNLYVVKEGAFCCKVLTDENITKEIPYDFHDICIIKELLDLQVNFQMPLLEMQCFFDKSKDENIV